MYRAARHRIVISEALVCHKQEVQQGKTDLMAVDGGQSQLDRTAVRA